MSDLNANVVASLRAELAEFKANANKVSESMGSEIMRLTAELEQQRTRADLAEQQAAELAGVVRDVSAMLAQAQEMLANG